jgi:hypothetical protein
MFHQDTILMPGDSGDRHCNHIVNCLTCPMTVEHTEGFIGVFSSATEIRPVLTTSSFYNSGTQNWFKTRLRLKYNATVPWCQRGWTLTTRYWNWSYQRYESSVCRCFDLLNTPWFPEQFLNHHHWIWYPLSARFFRTNRYRQKAPRQHSKTSMPVLAY